MKVLHEQMLLTGDRLTFYEDAAGETRINIKSAGNNETILPMEGYSDLSGARRALARVAAPLKAWVETDRHAAGKDGMKRQGPMCWSCSSDKVQLGHEGWKCLDCGFSRGQMEAIGQTEAGDDLPQTTDAEQDGEDGT